MVETKEVTIEWGESRGATNARREFHNRTCKLSKTITLSGVEVHNATKQTMVIAEEKEVLKNLVRSFLVAAAHDDNGVPSGGSAE